MSGRQWCRLQIHNSDKSVIILDLWAADQSLPQVIVRTEKHYTKNWFIHGLNANGILSGVSITPVTSRSFSFNI